MAIRRTLVLAAVVSALAASSTALAAPVFVVTGKGYGHAIGMSQYGAYGLALNGRSYDEILRRYYQGTEVTPGYPNPTVKVLLASGRSSLAVGSSSSFRLGTQTLPPGTYTVRPRPAEVAVAGNGTTTVVASPATFSPGTAALALDGLLYRGRLRVASSSSGTSLAALNTLPREDYLKGVVPREMPASWHAEALKTQAVAARTYAIATGGHCTWVDGDAVFCRDTSDQVYGGKSGETSPTNDAVDASTGRVITYEGAPATTLFFSTSGGRTAAKHDEWGGAAVPYLVSVFDPYDSISPHHLWGPEDAELDCPGTSPDCVYIAAGLQRALGLPQRPRDVVVTSRNASRRVTSLTATGAATTTDVSGASARAKLGLRSTWFHVGVLSLLPSAARVTYGSQVTLGGLARAGGTRGWETASLQRRRHGEASWKTIGTPLPDGAWSRVLKPVISTDYRVVSGNATGEARRVSVRTRVVFDAPQAPYTRLTGAVGPAGRGIVVTLERKRSDGTWAPRATTTTGAEGRFAFAVSKPGTYRARAAAGPGYLRGAATVTLPLG